MTDFIHVLEIISALAMPVIALVMVWVRKLIDEINGIKTSISRMDETMQREHGDVLKSITGLDGTLTDEVRGIVNQHSEHDKQNTRIEVKIDYLGKALAEIRKK